MMSINSDDKGNRSANITSNHSYNWATDRRSYGEVNAKDMHFSLGDSSDSFEDLSAAPLYQSPAYQHHYP